MRFLKKIALAICFILLLSGLKTIFARTFPHSLLFHYNLFSSIQLLLLLWAIITGLLENTIWKNSPPARARLKSLFSFLALLIFTEGGCFYLLEHPRSIPHPFVSAFQDYYNNYQRDILQYNKNISRYDPALFYRMKSDNRSVFSNIEFSDSIITDSSGFRTNGATRLPDSSRPVTRNDSTTKILCLGDSYTLGWGVQQDETYPARLEMLLKRPVLNTGMSSYGTAREIASIRHLDLSHASAIVIQYCFNDADENEAYVNDHDHLSISPESVYDSAANTLRWSKLYFPGKYFCTLSKLFLAGKASTLLKKNKPPTPRPDDPSATYDKEATWFLEVLKNSGLDFDRIHVFVFDIREYRNLTGKFLQALDRQLATPANTLLFKQHVHVLPVDGLFTAADYYILDEHLRASGQQKLAAYLANAITPYLFSPGK